MGSIFICLHRLSGFLTSRPASESRFDAQDRTDVSGQVQGLITFFKKVVKQASYGQSLRSDGMMFYIDNSINLCCYAKVIAKMYLTT